MPNVLLLLLHALLLLHCMLPCLHVLLSTCVCLVPCALACTGERSTCAPWPQTPTVSTTLSGRLTGIPCDKAHTCDMLRESRGGASWRAAGGGACVAVEVDHGTWCLAGQPPPRTTVLSPATRLPTAHPQRQDGLHVRPNQHHRGAGRRRARHTWMPGFRDPPACPMRFFACLPCPLRTFSVHIPPCFLTSCLFLLFSSFFWFGY